MMTIHIIAREDKQQYTGIGTQFVPSAPRKLFEEKAAYLGLFRPIKWSHTVIIRIDPGDVIQTKDN